MCAWTSASPARARWATNPRHIDCSSCATPSGSAAGPSVPAACQRLTVSANSSGCLREGGGGERPPPLPASHGVGEQLALSAVGGAGGRLQPGIALGVAPAVEGDEQAVDAVALVLPEVRD